MILRASGWRVSEPTTVRVSAAGQTLGACNFTMGMRTSAVRASASSTCTLRAVGRSDQNGTGADSKRWLGEERRRQTLFVQACAQLISRVPSPKGTLLQRGACRFRVQPPGQHLARSLSYCAARERVGSVYAGDGDSI